MTGREAGGCWVCAVGTPVVYLDIRHGREGFAHTPFNRPYALCLPCLGAWFPGWGSDRVQDWLDGQVHRREVWERDRAAWKELAMKKQDPDNRHLAAWLAGVTP